MSRSGTFCVFMILASALPFSSPIELDDDTKELMKMLHDTCVQETKVDENAIAEATKGNFAEDPLLKCYIKCLYMQLGAVDDKEHLDIDAVTDMLPPELKSIYEPTMRTCGFIIGADVCDSYFQTHKCWQKTDPTNYMLI